ncbi:MAG: hypothetical protein ACRC2S_02615, partial [Waterburya sp.]
SKMKKSTLGILTAIIAFSPLTAFAQDAQTSIQSNTNSAAAVGTGNYIDQNATQNSVQNQLDLGAYGVPTTPEVQTSVQGNANEATAIGGYNVIGQDATQNSSQGQVDVNQYLPYGY